jgi:trans-aconitate 2-methyltransferase
MEGASDWDARLYDRIAEPQARWGQAVLERLPLSGRETVLDAGCGSGRVTERLLERLPQGRVVALDASPAMLAEARRRLARFGQRVTFVEADLGRPLPLGQPADAVLSTATFHWVLDHDGLFRHLAAVMHPGALLVAQCGGAGNIAAVLAAAASVTGDPWQGPWRFATPDETRARLAAAGFVDVKAWLEPDPVRFVTGESLETFLRTIVLRHHLERLPEGARAGFVAAVARALPEPVIDYVRLNLVARRA